MKYDVRCLADDHPEENNRVRVSKNLGDDHAPGDRIKTACPYCGTYGPHEVVAPLEGLLEE